MLSSDIYTPISKLYRTLNFLKVDNICKSELAKFIHQLQHQNFSKFFSKSEAEKRDIVKNFVKKKSEPSVIRMFHFILTLFFFAEVLRNCLPSLMLLTHAILGRNNHVIIFYLELINNLTKIYFRFEVPNYWLVLTKNLKPTLSLYTLKKKN